MFRLVSTIASFLILAYGLWWVFNHSPGTRAFLQEHLETGDFLAFESQFTPESIVQKNPSLQKGQESTEGAELLFYPYLLMQVKYAQSSSTEEGYLLWSQEEGEMVFNTKTWEHTHGFQDCINADASQDDFRVLNALSRHGGSLSKEKLRSALRVEQGLLDDWLESCQKKQLVVEYQGDYRLHFKKAKLKTTPLSSIDEQQLVTKGYKGSMRMPRKYSESQLKRISKAAFGENFAIRKSVEVMVPVYRFSLQNSDGSIHTTYWNALTGKQIENALY